MSERHRACVCVCVCVNKSYGMCIHTPKYIMRRYTYIGYIVGHMPNSDFRKIRLLPEIREPNYYVTRGVCKSVVNCSLKCQQVCPST